ncbi:MAG: RNA polymerase sigma factor, partial [Acidimicrobiales bacterium]
MATDEELVVRYLGGERRALAEIYERYADRVHDLCVAMLGAHDDADDAFQDTFLVACRRMEGLRDPTRLRPWLYSIARNQCRSRIRSRRRTRPVDQAGATIGVEVDMTARVARDELSRLVSDARAGLNERDQEVLDLHLRHGLEGDDLAAVLGVSTTNAYKLVQRVRDRVERSLGALLVARHGREDCAELDAILRGWDGRFSPLMRKRVARHIDDCPVCERRRRGLLAPGGIASALPFVAAPAALHDAVLHRLGTADSSPPPPPPSREPASWDDSGFPRPEHGGGPTRRLTWWVALAVLVLTAAGIGALGARSLSPDESRSTVSTGSGSPATDADTPATTDAVHETDEIAAPAAPTTTPPTTPPTTTTM